MAQATMTADDLARDIWVRRFGEKLNPSWPYINLSQKQHTFLVDLARRNGQAQKRTHGMHVTTPGGQSSYTVEVLRGTFALGDSQVVWNCTPGGQLQVKGMAD